MKAPFAVAAALAAHLLAASAGAQAVTEWRTAGGLPVAVIEVAGGDVEHFAAVVPARAVLPAQVAGWPTAIAAHPGALVWSLRVPATVASRAALELAPLLAASGCGAVAAFGPVPARDLAGPLAALESLPAAAALRSPCPLADGRIEVVRGVPERVELVLAVPPADDPRFESLPALAALLEQRLAGDLPGVRAAIEVRDGCWWLLVRRDAVEESPRAVLHRLRAALARHAEPAVSELELAAVSAPLRRAAAQRAADGAMAAALVAERLAQGGRAAGALAPTVPAAAALGELLRATVQGRGGLALLTEAERRTRLEEPETLEGGVILTTRWLSEELAVLALAFGGVDPAAGRRVAAAITLRLAAAGWHATAHEVAGVAVVAAVLPPGDVPEALEALADELIAQAPLAAGGDLADDIATALGLLGAPAAETLSVALALPPEADEGVEAARKFLAGLPAGGVRTSAAHEGARLLWTPAGEPPRLAAIVELPATVAGWLAGEVLAARVGVEAALRAAWMSPAGGLSLVVFAEGEEHLPALDARLAAGWSKLKAPVTGVELDAAARRLFADLYGDLPAAMTRAALRPFLPAIPAEAELLAPDVEAVSAVFAGLPGWDALLRVARGPAPTVVAPPVRKSPRTSVRPPVAAAPKSP